MVKLISGVFLGILIFLLGVYFLIIYMDTRADGSSPLLLVPAVILVAGGVYCLLQFIRGHMRKDVSSDIGLTWKEAPSIIERNNEFIAEWGRTADTKDRLKMLKISAAAAEEK